MSSERKSPPPSPRFFVNGEISFRSLMALRNIQLLDIKAINTVAENFHVLYPSSWKILWGRTIDVGKKRRTSQ